MLWVSVSLLVMGLVLSSWLPNIHAAPLAGRVVSGAVGACGRARGDESFPRREEIIDMGCDEDERLASRRW